jgi:hypothetical protein
VRLGVRPARPGVLDEGPVVLLAEQAVDDREEFRRRRAARRHDRRQRQLVERELAEDEMDLAGVDVLRLQRVEGFLVELSAMAAGE